MIQQYSSFVDKQVNQHANGQQTLNENIADNSGIKQSFTAYQTWVKGNAGVAEPLLPNLNYTQNQLFYISMGQLFCAKMTPQMKMLLLQTDSHAPAELRVIGAAANSADFSRTFNCKSTQFENPAHKCSIW
jgi:membrane metallo-endopeptidase-like protein 1